MAFEEELAKPFHEGLEKGVLRLPKCGSCERFHWYPMGRCPHCRSNNLAWREVDPEGVLFSHSTVRHDFSGKGKRPVPYIIGLIELPAAPGVRLVAEIVPVAGTDASIGTRMRPIFPQAGIAPRLLYAPSAG